MRFLCICFRFQITFIWLLAICDVHLCFPYREMSGQIRPAPQSLYIRLRHQQNHPEMGDEQHCGCMKNPCWIYNTSILQFTELWSWWCPRRARRGCRCRGWLIESSFGKHAAVLAVVRWLALGNMFLCLHARSNCSFLLCFLFQDHSSINETYRIKFKR